MNCGTSGTTFVRHSFQSGTAAVLISLVPFAVKNFYDPAAIHTGYSSFFQPRSVASLPPSFELRVFPLRCCMNSTLLSTLPFTVALFRPRRASCAIEKPLPKRRATLLIDFGPKPEMSPEVRRLGEFRSSIRFPPQKRESCLLHALKPSGG